MKSNNAFLDGPADSKTPREGHLDLPDDGRQDARASATFGRSEEAKRDLTPTERRKSGGSGILDGM